MSQPKWDQNKTSLRRRMPGGNPFGVDVPLTEKPGGWFAQAGTENFPRVNFWVKTQILFLNFFLSDAFFLIFIVANKLLAFSINRLANVDDILNANMFLNCYKCEYKKISFKYICVVYYLKLCFYCLTWSVTDSEILVLKIEMLLVFQNNDNIEIIGF